MLRCVRMTALACYPQNEGKKAEPARKLSCIPDVSVGG